MEAHHFSAITKSHYEVTFLFFALWRSLPLMLMPSSRIIQVCQCGPRWRSFLNKGINMLFFWRFVTKYGSAVMKQEQQTSHLCVRQSRSRSIQVVTPLESIAAESCWNRIRSPTTAFSHHSWTPHADGGDEDWTLSVSCEVATGTIWHWRGAEK